MRHYVVAAYKYCRRIFCPNTLILSFCQFFCHWTSNPCQTSRHNVTSTTAHIWCVTTPTWVTTWTFQRREPFRSAVWRLNSLHNLTEVVSKVHSTFPQDYQHFLLKGRISGTIVYGPTKWACVTWVDLDANVAVFLEQGLAELLECLECNEKICEKIIEPVCVMSEGSDFSSNDSRTAACILKFPWAKTTPYGFVTIPLSCVFSPFFMQRTIEFEVKWGPKLCRKYFRMKKINELLAYLND